MSKTLEERVVEAEKERDMLSTLYDKEVLAHGETDTRAEAAEQQIAQLRSALAAVERELLWLKEHGHEHCFIEAAFIAYEAERFVRS